MSNIAKYDVETFDSIKHINEDGQEFWYARELQKVLEYTEWRNFEGVIGKAQTACEQSGNQIDDHFVDVNKTIEMPKKATKSVNDYELSRYACYLIVMNGDPRKEVIALGQTYFAVKTRQQEIIENYENLSEAQKRLAIRNEIVNHNKALADAANKAGVKEPVEFAVFQNYGYRGLYGGMDMKAIHAHKGLKKSQKILDHMGSTELAANLFRATQAEEKLRRDNVQGKANANKTHYEVGAKVRQTIKELGGTMPEDLPTPNKSIQQIEREIEKKKLRGNDNE
ncbi:MAG: DNA damage-inducible protein D [Firmicutes bacterium HGW-Firmicutes-16]|nr:MAG: DNA damage-inducible protein D [Firmicutes bacterium HGW-Firmicutes-16]